MARKTKINEDVLAHVRSCIELGMSYGATAGVIGVTPETFSHWMTWGKSADKDPMYCKLYSTVKEAEGKLMEECLTTLKKNMNTGMSPQSIQWLLERRFPAEFGKQSNVNVKSQNESVNINVEAPKTWSEKEAARANIVGILSKIRNEGKQQVDEEVSEKLFPRK